MDFHSFLQTQVYNTDSDMLSESVSLSLKLEKNIKKEGLWIEFGVFSGRTINFISSLNPNQTIFGFDSFIGLPEDWRGNMTKGWFDCHGKMPDVNGNVTLIAGWFDATLPKFLKKYPKRHISFLHIYSDIYSSAKTILFNCHEKIIRGTIIVFDEFYNYQGYEHHEYKAWKEYCETFNVKFKYIGHTLSEQVMVEVL